MGEDEKPDPQLKELLSAWKALPDHVRETVVTLVMEEYLEGDGLELIDEEVDE